MTTSRAAGLEAAHGVRRFEFDTHSTPERGLQRFATEQRAVQEDRIDHAPGCPDPGIVKAGLLDGVAATPVR
jgi:hypothetical protein